MTFSASWSQQSISLLCWRWGSGCCDDTTMPFHLPTPYRLTRSCWLSGLQPWCRQNLMEWVNREYSRGLRTYPCVKSVWRGCCQSSQPVVCPSGGPGSSCKGWCPYPGLWASLSYYSWLYQRKLIDEGEIVLWWTKKVLQSHLMLGQGFSQFIIDRNTIHNR